MQQYVAGIAIMGLVLSPLYIPIVVTLIGVFAGWRARRSVGEGL